MGGSHTRRVPESARHPMAVPAGRFSKVWMHPECFPVIGAVGAGCLLSAFFGCRHLFACPDVYVGKHRRTTGDIEKNDTVSGANFHNHAIRDLSKSTFGVLGLLHYNAVPSLVGEMLHGAKIEGK